MRLNIRRMVADLGGPARVARAIGATRSTPYRWIANDFIASPQLCELKKAFPALSIDSYFEDNDDQDGTGCGTRGAG